MANRGLGTDPLDLLTTDTTDAALVGKAVSVALVGSVASGGLGRPAKRRVEPVKFDGEVLDQARAAVWWLMNHGQPTATLKAVGERALLTEVQRLADEYNDGQPFPPGGPLPRGSKVQWGGTY